MSNQLQNKLLHYEVQPPAEVWSKITGSLDEKLLPSLSEKLYQFEETPSPGIWNKIQTQLEQVPEEKTKVVPFYIRYGRPLKYSGAVAAMIVVAAIVSLLVSKRTESGTTTENITTTIKEPDTNTTINESPGDEISKSVSKYLEREENISSFSKTKSPRTKQVYYESSLSIPQHFLPRIVDKDPIINSSTVPQDKYVIYSDGNGNAIRLPKKIYNAVACPTDNFDCKRRLKELKEKFVSAAVTSDFNGILEILRSLQENQ